MLGAKEARQDSNIMTGIEPSELGFRYEIEIASGQLVKIYKKRPRESNANSSLATQNYPSSSLPLDAMIDENDDESSHPNSSSLSQQVSSSSTVVSRVRQNSSHESTNFDTILSETINLQTQQRDAHREGLRSIEQALKNMMGGKQR
nr:hypothetical protein [Tanacetum cinerariifolium]